MDSETQRLIEAAATAGARKYAAIQKKEQQKKIMRNTYMLMDNYLALKDHTEHAISESMQTTCNESTDCQYLDSIRRSRAKTMIMITHIDEAVKELKNESISSGEYYKFKAFDAYYKKRKTYEDIQEELNCGKNSPARWCKDMIKKLSVKLFGIDGIDKW